MIRPDRLGRMTTTETLEAIATEVLNEAGLGGAVDAYRLCAAARLRVVLGEPGAKAAIVGSRIFVDPLDPIERQRFAAAHELSHLLLRERGIRDTEWRVNWLASALIHPRAWFEERLTARGWDLAELRIDCPYSSWEAIGRRVVNLQRAVLWTCDRGPEGRKSYRVRSLGVPRKLETPTPIEWSLVRDAAATLEPHRTDAVGAWPLPLPDRGRLRVICLGRADALLAA